MPSETIPEHADPALRRGATAAESLAATASRFELATSLDSNDTAFEVVFERDDAAETARAIRVVLQRLGALEAVQARVLDRIGALRETYRCGSAPWIAVNTAQLNVAALFRAARVLTPEEGR